MRGGMQDWPLLVHKIIDHAATYHGTRKVIARRAEGTLVRTDYRGIRTEALRVTARLVAHGIAPGDRVAALCFNTDRHLALWYGVMGAGAVHHTVNPRLFREQIVYIINDAEDRLLFADVTLLPLLETIAADLKTVEQIVLLADRAAIGDTALDLLSFDEWMGDIAPGAWVAVDEGDAAGMCYTSGTTGAPKGVVYSHRSNVLHALASATPDMLGLSARDTVLPAVPMFHANGWTLAFSAPMVGAALVLPGPALDGASVHRLMEDEGVTFTAGVPTVWLNLLQHLDDTGAKLSTLERAVIGGSACPPAIIERFAKDHGVTVLHAWGMTEMSPLGTVAAPLAAHGTAPPDVVAAMRESQGRPPFTVEMMVSDDEGTPLPWDGRTYGRLKVRGPAVAAHYHRDADASVFDKDGWFDTGDVAHIDADGYLRITDRSKDVIKSGGEWISSIELENLAVSHPDVAEAAVVGIAHPKWDERPLLIVVPKPGRQADAEAILAHMAPRIAKWWLPDKVAFVETIPHTATGKIQKTALRETFRDVYAATPQSQRTA